MCDANDVAYSQVVIDVTEWMSAFVKDTMAARVKIISLLLVVSLAYAGYMMLQTHGGRSHTNDLQHDALDSHLRLSGAGPPMNQGKTVVVSADGAPIDVRSEECRRRRYINVERLTATLVVDVPGTGFNVNQFYSTIQSLLSGAQSFVDEVIVVASGLQDPVATQLDRYLASVGVEARLVRSAGAGQAASRAAGAKLAKSPVVVFADGHVIGTVGWLRPLLGALAREPNSILMPHVNDASDQTAFATTPERLLAEYTWPLSVRLVENASAVPSRGLYRSPALRGNLFAVRRSFWNELGGYDDALGDDSAAAHLELSIRAWQCGAGGGTGAILMHQCSHVGVRDIHEVARVVKPSNVRYIARLWFGNLETIMLKSSGVLSDSEVTLSNGNRGGCRDIETYFNNIAVVPVPSAEAIHFGQLQASTGRHKLFLLWQVVHGCEAPYSQLYQL